MMRSPTNCREEECQVLLRISCWQIGMPVTVVLCGWIPMSVPLPNIYVNQPSSWMLELGETWDCQQISMTCPDLYKMKPIFCNWFYKIPNFYKTPDFIRYRFFANYFWLSFLQCFRGCELRNWVAPRRVPVSGQRVKSQDSCSSSRYWCFT